MEIGTAEPVTQPPVKARKLRRGSGGGRRGGGGSDGGDNGGDGTGGKGPDPRGAEDLPTTIPDKSRVVTWFLLLVVTMTFGGLIGAYVVVSTHGQSEWQPFRLPVQIWISTALLLSSSIAYAFAQRAIFQNQHERGRKWLIATTALGAAFISSQIIVWLALTSQGIYMRGNPYAGFFYILTAVHAVHILGGIVALGAIQIRAWHPTFNEHELKHRRDLARGVGWYWHFMDLIWLVLLFLLSTWT
jgi:cytochrome c oxidase subunit 3